MRRRSFLLWLAGALLAGCGGEVLRPSVLLITVDTLRADAVGVYGGRGASTPRMDRLAAEGLRFARAKTVAPLTLPSHATILTGLLPPEHGLRDNDPEFPLPGRGRRDFRTVAEALGDAGYDTAAFVSVSLLSGRTGLGRGFSVYDGPGEGAAGPPEYVERRGERTVERASEWLGRARRPFFLWVHLFDPHEPYAPPGPFRPAGTAGPRESYAAEVSYADRCLGLLLDRLEEAGEADRALVVLTSDHGEGLGEHGERSHGFFLHETTMSVPLLVRWPGLLVRGEVREDLVGLADVASVLLRAAGEAPVSILEGPAPRAPRAETLLGYRHMGWAQLLAAWRGDRKLVRGPVDAWFDLASDPGERRPLAAGPGDLVRDLEEYRRLAPRVERAGEAVLEPIVSLPYLSGLGRGRRSLLPPEENERLPAPDARRLEGIERVLARVGRADPALVEEELEALLREDPANPTLHTWRGRNAQAANDPEAAARAFERAVELGFREEDLRQLAR